VQLQQRMPGLRTTIRLPRQLVLLLVATFLTCSLGWLFKAHCSFDGGWSASEQYTTGCYSDAMPFWGGREIAAGKLPYFEARMEYPVLTGALIYLDGRITAVLFGKAASAPYFLFVVALINTLIALLVTALLWSMRLAQARLWCWALAPPLILYIGHNWDILAVALAVGALTLAQRGRLTQAAGLATLGGAAKLFPLLLLPLLGLRPLVERRILATVTMVATAIGAWGLVNALPALLAWTNWLDFYTFSSSRSGTAASIWELAGQFGWLQTDIAERNLWSAALFVAGAGAIVVPGARRHWRHLWVLFTPVAAWFLLVNKVYSPQFDLWIFPLLLITSRRMSPVALFLVGDLLAYVAEFWFFAGQEGAWPATGQREILIAAAVRGAAMLWIIGDAVFAPPPAWVDRPGDARDPARGCRFNRGKGLLS
jgi:uncharacterized membrane protein